MNKKCFNFALYYHFSWFNSRICQSQIGILGYAKKMAKSLNARKNPTRPSFKNDLRRNKSQSGPKRSLKEDLR